MTSTSITATSMMAHEERMCLQRALGLILGHPVKFTCTAGSHEGADARVCTTCIVQESQLAIFINPSDIVTVGRLAAVVNNKQYSVAQTFFAVRLVLQCMIDEIEKVMPPGYFSRAINVTESPQYPGEMVSLAGIAEYITAANALKSATVKAAEIINVVEVPQVTDSDSDSEEFELIYSSDDEEWELL